MTDSLIAQPARLRAMIAELGLSIRSEFVPWSRSCNFNPSGELSDRSLNWRVTLVHAGRDILTTDYSAGIGYCPSYPSGSHPTMNDAELIEYETEHGKRATRGGGLLFGRGAIEPNVADVIHGLVSDAWALDYTSFEEWADDMDCDTDSRAAEKNYRACLVIGLRLRNSLGEENLTKLREAARDY